MYTCTDTYSFPCPCRLLIEMPQDGEKGKSRLAAQQFLIKERVTGPAELSRIDFASLINRFCSIAELPFQEVASALHSELPQCRLPACSTRFTHAYGLASCLIWEGVSLHVPHRFVSYLPFIPPRVALRCVLCWALHRRKWFI